MAQSHRRNRTGLQFQLSICTVDRKTFREVAFVSIVFSFLSCAPAEVPKTPGARYSFACLKVVLFFSGEPTPDAGRIQTFSRPQEF